MSMSVPSPQNTTTSTAPHRRRSTRAPIDSGPPAYTVTHSSHPTPRSVPPSSTKHTQPQTGVQTTVTHPAVSSHRHHHRVTHSSTAPPSKHTQPQTGVQTTVTHPAASSHRHHHRKQPKASMDAANNVGVRNGAPVAEVHRIKPNRSMTSAPANVPAPPQPTRSHSSDILDRQGADKARKPALKTPVKKPTHVDVIDKLDYSGIGAATFHHDGPFDACAPSRNKNKTKAPVYAFDGDIPLQQAEGQDKRLSPLAQATILAMKQNPGSSPYAVVGSLNTDVQSYGKPPSPTYASPKKKSPKKSALAEAWGMAEPEPFEEFSAGRQSGYERDSPMSGSLTSVNATARTGMTTRGDPFPEYPDSSRPPNARRPSRALPPPQPIQLYPEFPEGDDPTFMNTAPSAYGPRPSGPKRSRSLMQRFRKMRDSPNAPPQTAYDDDTSQPSDVRLVSQRAPPVPERRPAEPYVMIDTPRGGRDKNLPMPPPPPPPNVDFFEPQHGTMAPGGTGMTRKGSIMQKVKGVMSR